MAEYIDREEFKRKLIDEKSFFPAIVSRALEEMPTADVVPKSEVDILKSLITHKEDEAYECGYAEGKSDVIITNYAEQVKEYAREIFEDIEKHRDKIHGIALLLPEELAELKKKYTGE